VMNGRLERVWLYTYIRLAPQTPICMLVYAARNPSFFLDVATSCVVYLDDVPFPKLYVSHGQAPSRTAERSDSESSDGEIASQQPRRSDAGEN
jgi:hypothetical protein